MDVFEIVQSAINHIRKAAIEFWGLRPETFEQFTQILLCEHINVYQFSWFKKRQAFYSVKTQICGFCFPRFSVHRENRKKLVHHEN